MRTLAVLVVLAAGGAAFGVTTTPAATPPPCKVPRLTGLTTAQARAALKRAGCPTSALKTATKCTAKTTLVGKVLDQTPARRTVLPKGRKVSVHLGVFCAPEPPPAPPAPPNFVGDFAGTYSGLLVGSTGCPDIPIGGQALVRVVQLSQTSYDVLFQLENAHVVTGEQCVEIGRDTSVGEELTTVSGTKLSSTRLTVTLTGDTLVGKFQVRGGEFNFTVTRIS